MRERLRPYLAFEEEAGAFRDASGLVGPCGDPSDVTPKQLEEFVEALVRVAAKARQAVKAWNPSPTADPAMDDALTNLADALEKLPAEWGTRPEPKEAAHVA